MEKHFFKGENLVLKNPHHPGFGEKLKGFPSGEVPNQTKLGKLSFSRRCCNPTSVAVNALLSYGTQR